MTEKYSIQHTEFEMKSILNTQIRNNV